MLLELENLSQLKIIEKTEPDILPNIFFIASADHHLLWKNLERIENENQVADSEGTSYQSTPRRSIKSPTGELFLPKKCLICRKVKFIRKTRTREILVLCTNLRADQTLEMACQQKTGERMIAAGSDTLVAKKRIITRLAIKALPETSSVTEMLRSRV